MRTTRGEKTIRAASRSIAIVLAACALAACSSAGGESVPNVDVSTSTGALNVAFANASAHAAVPRDLLVAIARVEDGLGIPAQRLDLEQDSAVPAAGPLMLRRGKL